MLALMLIKASHVTHFINISRRLGGERRLFDNVCTNELASAIPSTSEYKDFQVVENVLNNLFRSFRPSRQNDCDKPALYFGQYLEWPFLKSRLRRGGGLLSRKRMHLKTEA
jgi:hypothetical protein